MKNRPLRFFALLLAILMVGVLLVACKDPETPVDPGKTPGTDDPNKDPDQNPDEFLPENVDVNELIQTFEKKDYEQEEFVVLASSTFQNIFTIHQFPVDDASPGDMIQNSLYNRDALLEDYFNVQIVYDDRLDTAMFSQLLATSSGSGDYDLVLGNLSNVTVPMFNNDLLYDLNQMELLDFSKPWWHQKAVDSFTYNDRIYFATGAITNRSVYAAYAMLFNRAALEDLEMESPYGMVAENRWVWDNFLSMVENSASDVGDSWTTEDSFYGLAPSSDSETAFFYGCGGRFLTKDETGEYLVTLGTEDNYDILEDVANLMNTDDVFNYVEVYDSVDLFRESKALFLPQALCDLTMLNEMVDPYGIVPMPKYSELQEQYFSNANMWISTMAMVPVGVEEVEDTARIIEAIAAVSQYTSFDAQYETILLDRQALDAESEACLRLVVDSVAYDWLYAFDMAGMGSEIRELIRKGETDYSSLFAEKQDVLEEELNSIKAHYGK